MLGNKGRYRRAIRRLVAQKLERAWQPLSTEDLAARCGWALGLAERERPLKVRNRLDLAHPDVAAELVQRSYALRLTSPRDSLRIAKAAVDAAEHTPFPVAAPVGLRRDLQAHAWANLANAFRLVEDYDQAESAWDVAEGRRAVGTGDPYLRADMQLKTAELRRAQGRFDAAISLYQRAAYTNERLKEVHSAGRCRLNLAYTHYCANNSRQALAEADRAADLLDGRKEPEMIVALWHNSVLFFEDDGQPDAALLLLPRLDPWYEEMKAPLLTLRARWVRSRLHLALGETRAAVHYGEAARRGLLAHGQLFDAALCGFDVALAWMHQGGHLPAQRLALEMYGVFSAKEIPREAAAALILFADAARAGRLNLEMMKKWAEALKPQRKPGGAPAGKPPA